MSKHGRSHCQIRKLCKSESSKWMLKKRTLNVSPKNDTGQKRSHSSIRCSTFCIPKLQSLPTMSTLCDCIIIVSTSSNCNHFLPIQRSKMRGRGSSRAPKANLSPTPVARLAVVRCTGNLGNSYLSYLRLCVAAQLFC